MAVNNVGEDIASANQKAKRRLHHLDGLRGWAALTVLIAHLMMRYGISYDHFNDDAVIQYLLYRTPIFFLHDASSAVKIFFIVSGFSLAYYFFLGKNHYKLFEMAILRFFRLGIPVICSALVVYFCFKLDLYRENNARLYRSHLPELDAWQVIYGTAIKDVIGIDSSYLRMNLVFWTMPIEFIASMGIFTALFVSEKFNSWLRIFTYFLLVVYFRDSHFLGFVFGVALCDVTVNFFIKNQENSRYIRQLCYRSEVYIIVSLFLFYWSIRAFPRFSSIVQYHIMNEMFYGFLVALSFFMIASFGYTKRFFSTRLSQYLGKISFPLYLIHMPVINSFSFWLSPYLESKISDPTVVAVCWFLFSIIVTLLCSYLFLILIETMLLQLIMGRLKTLLYRVSSKFFVSKQHSSI